MLGHELSGTIEAVGAGVDPSPRGERVAIEPQRPCHRCAQCLAGRYNLCPHMRFYATPPSTAPFPEFVTIEASSPTPARSVSFEAGALLEPLSVGIAAVRQGRHRPGASVLFAGAGPIGHLRAGREGVRRVRIVVSDLVAERRDRALQYGATEVVDPTVVSVASDIVPVDAFIDASGAARAVSDGIKAVGPAGAAVLVGLGNSEMTLRSSTSRTSRSRSPGSSATRTRGRSPSSSSRPGSRPRLARHRTVRARRRPRRARERHRPGVAQVGRLPRGRPVRLTPAHSAALRAALCARASRAHGARVPDSVAGLRGSHRVGTSHRSGREARAGPATGLPSGPCPGTGPPTRQPDALRFAHDGSLSAAVRSAPTDAHLVVLGAVGGLGLRGVQRGRHDLRLQHLPGEPCLRGPGPRRRHLGGGTAAVERERAQRRVVSTALTVAGIVVASSPPPSGGSRTPPGTAVGSVLVATIASPCPSAAWSSSREPAVPAARCGAPASGPSRTRSRASGTTPCSAGRAGGAEGGCPPSAVGRVLRRDRAARAAAGPLHPGLRRPRGRRTPAAPRDGGVRAVGRPRRDRHRRGVARRQLGPAVRHRPRGRARHAALRRSPRAYADLGRDVARLWRERRNVLAFLLASAVFRDGVGAVFTFGGKSPRRCSGSVPSQVSSSPSLTSSRRRDVVSGWLDDRFGSRRSSRCRSSDSS